jgi:hypothetical protein
MRRNKKKQERCFPLGAKGLNNDRWMLIASGQMLPAPLAVPTSFRKDDRLYAGDFEALPAA